MKFMLLCRELVTVCTDPKRRCYDGVWFSSKEEWSAWKPLLIRSGKESLEESAQTFRKYNPKTEYKIAEVGDAAQLP